MLLGILAMNDMGLYGVLLYTLVYVFANLGIWATVLMLRRHEYAGERVDDFEGLHKRAPFWAFAMVIFLLSLGGIPPTAGFIGKYFLFAAAVKAGFGWLAIIAVLMSAVSMFFYFRIVVAMYLREGREAEVAITPSLKWVAATLKAADIPFALGGSFAVYAHGGHSSDHDVDFLIREQDKQQALAELAKVGFRVEQPPEDWLVKVYDEDRMVDLIYRPVESPVWMCSSE